MHRICLITGTRADWGLLRPLAEVLYRNPEVELQIVATNMHLMPRYGFTVSEIEAAGLPVTRRVPLSEHPDTPCGRAAAAGECMQKMAEAFAELRPDAVVVLGDRWEILAAASAATIAGIPLVHISGGEVTLGAIDERLRHAITKLATLHLTATEEYRRRVIQMGENSTMVVNTGALGVWNAMNRPIMSLSALNACPDINIDLSQPYILATMHPATAGNEASEELIGQFLKAIESFPKLNVLMTYPNNDAGAGVIIDRIETAAREHPGRICVVKSLGMERYLAAAMYARAVVGNSSSGVVEVPSCGTPTVDIGTRQQGRVAAASVIHCTTDTGNIIKAINQVLTPEMQVLAARRENPYYRPDTPQAMHRAILDMLACDHNKLSVKPFIDIKFGSIND